MWTNSYTEFLYLTNSFEWLHTTDCNASDSQLYISRVFSCFLIQILSKSICKSFSSSFSMCLDICNHRYWELQLIIQNVSIGHQNIMLCKNYTEVTWGFIASIHNEIHSEYGKCNKWWCITALQCLSVKGSPCSKFDPCSEMLDPHHLWYQFTRNSYCILVSLAILVLMFVVSFT